MLYYNCILTLFVSFYTCLFSIYIEFVRGDIPFDFLLYYLHIQFIIIIIITKMYYYYYYSR
jgi:hypothetical protein